MKACLVLSAALIAAPHFLIAADHPVGDFLQPYLARHVIAGAVTLVGTPAGVVDLEATGYADVAGGRLMRPDTLFWIASMSKPLTATGAMMLVDEGKLGLDDPIEKYIPAFHGQQVEVEAAPGATPVLEPESSPILIRNLLSHTSGLPMATPAEHPTFDTLSLEAAVQSYARARLLYQPGAGYRYSNAGMNTIGRVIELLSGIPYQQFMDERLFLPLGMKDTTYLPTAEQVRRLAKTYVRDPQTGTLREMPLGGFKYPLDDPARRPVPAGGYFSTAADLGRFCAMMLKGGTLDGRRYLSAASIAQMTAKETGPKVSTFYGFGWDTFGHGIWVHGGGYQTMMAIDPQRRFYAIFLIQYGGKLPTPDAAGLKSGFVELAAKLAAPPTAAGPSAEPAPTADSLVAKIQAEVAGTLPASPDGAVNPRVPQGLFLHGSITDSRIYPGTENGYIVYVPAEYDASKPACLLVQLDGFGGWQGTVFDNLIAEKAMPVTIGVGVVPGTIWRDPPTAEHRAAYRFNRSYEFDSMNGDFPNYVLNELLPAVAKLRTPDGRPLRISADPNDRAVAGGSSGAIGAFTLAWQRPDQFSRIFSYIGTYVSMRGGHEYPALVRKTEPKPLRVFLEDGSTDAWNPLFGSWFDANLNMDSAFRFAGYDEAHAWGTHGHNGKTAAAIFPDVMRWLWRDYPRPIAAGRSENSALQELTLPGEGWKRTATNFAVAGGLAADSRGEVFVTDPAAGTVYRLGGEGVTPSTLGHQAGMTAQVFAPDGTLYGVVPGERRVVALDAAGTVRTLSEGIVGRAITAMPDGSLVVSEPAEHPDLPGRIWRIDPSGEKRLLDAGAPGASAMAFSPDGSLFVAADGADRWVYSYAVGSDGSLIDRQRFYWLHITDVPANSGAAAVAFDRHGNLYVATRLGVQICDQNGRVRAILPLPGAGGPVRSLCFGGANFDILFVSDGARLYERRLAVPGVAPAAAPLAVKSQGAG